MERIDNGEANLLFELSNHRVGDSEQKTIGLRATTHALINRVRTGVVKRLKHRCHLSEILRTRGVAIGYGDFHLKNHVIMVYQIINRSSPIKRNAVLLKPSAI
jgi:hypothetical protein